MLCLMSLPCKTQSLLIGSERNIKSFVVFYNKTQVSHVYYSNRIPHGARYARNGSVKSVVFDGNKIKAKVQGSRVRPYTVTMVINKFSESEKERLIDGILVKKNLIAFFIRLDEAMGEGKAINNSAY